MAAISWDLVSPQFWAGVAILIPYIVVFILIAFHSSRYDISKLSFSSSVFPLVSIVIPTYNEQHIIRSKISNLQSLDYPKTRLEILVVDCSTDSTPDILRELSAQDPRIKVIEEQERKGLAAALNLGYAEASGAIVVKSDADAVILTSDAILRIVQLLENPRVGGVCGIYTAAEDIEGSFRSLENLQQMAETMIDSTIVAHGSLAAFKKEAMKAVEPTSTADDTEMFMKIRRSGYRTILDDRIWTSEPYSTKVRWRMDQKARRAGGVIRVLLANVDLLLTGKNIRFSYGVYLMDLLMLIILPWAAIVEAVLVFLACESLFGLIAVPIFGALILFAVGSYVLNRPRFLAAFVDIWLSCVVGQINLFFSNPDFMWAKSQREPP